jgi:hypothetical protein
MSGFTKEERDEESARRKAADLARDVPPSSSGQGPTTRCVHCQREFAMTEGHVGEVSLCDRCLHSG